MPSWPALDHPRRQSRLLAARVATPGAILLLLLVGALLTVVAAGDNVLPGDVAVARRLQSVDLPGAGAVARAANAAGTAQGTIALAVPLAVALAARGRFAAAALILAK